MTLLQFDYFLFFKSGKIIKLDLSKTNLLNEHSTKLLKSSIVRILKLKVTIQ